MIDIYFPDGNTYSIIRDKAEGPDFLKKLSNYTVRVGSDVTFTCNVENISNYKVENRKFLFGDKETYLKYLDTNILVR